MHDVVMVGNFPENPSLMRGGVQASVYGLAMAMRARSNVTSVTVIALASKHTTVAGDRNVNGIVVHYLTAPARYLASSVVHLPKVLRRVRRLPNPVIHVHGTGLFQAGLAMWVRATGYKFVWTLHGITRKETLNQYRRKPSANLLMRFLFFSTIEWLLERLASHIIVDTRYVATELKRKTGVFIVPQGLFPKELSTQRKVGHDPSLILSIGVFGPRKGHHLLLDAFAAIRTSCPGARLAIAGAISDRRYYNALVSRAAELGCDDVVSFHPDAERSCLIELLQAASIFALHSQEESQGIAVCEALFIGLPVVSTLVGGIPDVVEHGRTGLLSEYGDIPAFSESLRRVLVDTDLRNRMSVAAATAGQFYDWQQIAHRIDAIYRPEVDNSNLAPQPDSAIKAK